MTKYKLQSTPPINTPGYIAWAINDYRPPKKPNPDPFNPKRLRCIHLLGAAFPSLPFGVVADIVDRKIRPLCRGRDQHRHH